MVALPLAVMPVHVPVIGRIDNQGVVEVAASIEFIQEDANLIVEHANSRVILRQRFFCSPLIGRDVAGRFQMGLFIFRNIPKAGLPVMLRQPGGVPHKRKMSIGRPDKQEKRLFRVPLP